LSLGGTWDEFPAKQPSDTAASADEKKTSATSSSPQQTLVFVGQHLKKEVLRADLEALVLTDEEQQALSAHEAKTRRSKSDAVRLKDVFEDPFDAFPLLASFVAEQPHMHAAGHHHGHGHDHPHTRSGEPVKKKSRTQQ
jgi:hypothetical protein